jgi:hypothetical protein
MSTEHVLISRICHDLIAPFNAINLGLEAFEGSRDESMLECVKESVNKAGAIMKFTRELFTDRSETFCYSCFSLKQQVADFLKLHNISFDLKSDMESIASIAGKIIMYTAIVAKEIMPFGGTVVIRIDDALGEIVTRCRGKSVNVPEMHMIGDVNYRNVIRHCLMKLLQESEFDLSVRQEGADVVFYKKII